MYICMSSDHHTPHTPARWFFSVAFGRASASQQQSHMGGVCNPSSRSTRSTWSPGPAPLADPQPLPPGGPNPYPR